MKDHSGFTLIELLLSLCIAGIIATLSIPLSNVVSNNRNLVYINQFVAILNFARSESIKRGTIITLCRYDKKKSSSNSRQCSGGKHWEDGWILFVDYNGDGKVTHSKNSQFENDRILKVNEGLPHGYTLHSKKLTRIKFNELGMSRGYLDTWTLCSPDRKAKFARAVIVSIAGRIRTSLDSNGNGIRDNGRKPIKELSC